MTMNNEESANILPQVSCREVTEWFDSLPPRDQLTDDHAPILMAIESHRHSNINHSRDCFSLRKIH